jgi:hypothetical protein
MYSQAIILADSSIMKIGNFGEMQMRYQLMPLASRASAVISDAEAAFAIVKRILIELSTDPKRIKAVASLRNNSIIVSRIRPSEAKTVFMDESVDFIQTSLQKLEGWKQILQNIAQGKTQATVIKDNFSQHVALTGASGYLAIIKLIIPEFVKRDKTNEDGYNSALAELRRCTTILSDCECASEFNSVLIH